MMQETRDGEAAERETTEGEAERETGGEAEAGRGTEIEEAGVGVGVKREGKTE